MGDKQTELKGSSCNVLKNGFVWNFASANPTLLVPVSFTIIQQLVAVFVIFVEQFTIISCLSAGQAIMTRMHSSRMRTICNSSHLLAGGCLVLEGCLVSGGTWSWEWEVPGLGGCLVPGGVCSQGGLLRGRGVISQLALSQTPSCGQNDRQV